MRSSSGLGVGLVLALAAVGCHAAADTTKPDGAPPSVGGNGEADAGSTVEQDAAATATTDMATAASPDLQPAPPALRVVGYLPNYSGSYADWAKSIDFSKMTHLNLAFATANSSNAWDLGAADSDVKALVDAAHAAGVKVLASLGGGGGDQSVIAQYNTASNLPALIGNLDTLVATHDLDGVDIDIEDPNNLGATYTGFVNAVVAKLRPEGKLVTAAVAQYLQDSMADDTLHSFDFINVMIYSNYNDSVSAMTYYSQTKSVPNGQITLGAGFFGSDSNGDELGFKDIVAADGSAWMKDSTTVNGTVYNYTGDASMLKLANYAKGFGGIMFWELSEDTTDAHSLYKVIQSAY